MAYYRAYQLSHDDHIAHPAAIIEADNDDAAIEKANELGMATMLKCGEAPGLSSNSKAKMPVVGNDECRQCRTLSPQR